jgi:hypothetical protein
VSDRQLAHWMLRVYRDTMAIRSGPLVANTPSDKSGWVYREWAKSGHGAPVFATGTPFIQEQRQRGEYVHEHSLIVCQVDLVRGQRPASDPAVLDELSWRISGWSGRTVAESMAEEALREERTEKARRFMESERARQQARRSAVRESFCDEQSNRGV